MTTPDRCRLRSHRRGQPFTHCCSGRRSPRGDVARADVAPRRVSDTHANSADEGWRCSRPTRRRRAFRPTDAGQEGHGVSRDGARPAPKHGALDLERRRRDPRHHPKGDVTWAPFTNFSRSRSIRRAAGERRRSSRAASLRATDGRRCGPRPGSVPTRGPQENLPERSRGGAGRGRGAARGSQSASSEPRRQVRRRDGDRARSQFCARRTVADDVRSIESTISSGRRELFSVGALGQITVTRLGA